MHPKIEEIDDEVNRAVSLIRRGYSRGVILGKLAATPFSKQEIFEMAKCRIKARDKFGELASVLFFDEEGLRYATPPPVAEYRAKRICDESIADVSCGLGVQLIYFSRYASHAVGVEIDPFRARLAMLNMAATDSRNCTILEGDAFDENIVGAIDAECVFSDPSRGPEEKKRTFETLRPNPARVYERYRKKTDAIAFELPPRISRNEIMIEGEKEYTSLHFSLNRLALYTGSLAGCSVSAVSLPSEERVTDEDESTDVPETGTVLDHVYEVDDTVVRAGLLENLAGILGFDGGLLKTGKRRNLLTSETRYESAFLRGYVKRGVCSFSHPSLHRMLRELGAGKVTLRFSVAPREYWKIRKKLEEGLRGERAFHVFRVKDRALICEPIGSSEGVVKGDETEEVKEHDDSQ